MTQRHREKTFGEERAAGARKLRLGGSTHQSASVSLGPLVQQHFAHAVVTAVGRHVEGGQVVQGDVVDLRVVLEELPDAVHVVALGRHVDGGQAVLERWRESDKERERDGDRESEIGRASCRERVSSPV